jgi:hypothetical protein
MFNRITGVHRTTQRKTIIPREEITIRIPESKEQESQNRRISTDNLFKDRIINMRQWCDK